MSAGSNCRRCHFSWSSLYRRSKTSDCGIDGKRLSTSMVANIVSFGNVRYCNWRIRSAESLMQSGYD